ncbi:MAG: hypothetical protein VX589_18080 [Myxococcota bacterium]|nr:hypothetical protein [Myxococcota bacterium]
MTRFKQSFMALLWPMAILASHSAQAQNSGSPAQDTHREGAGVSATKAKNTETSQLSAKPVAEGTSSTAGATRTKLKTAPTQPKPTAAARADAPTNENVTGIDFSFPEDRTRSEGWRFGWHGYARLPIRFVDHPLGEREPLLVDDSYRESGFNYLRINETEWVELALSAQRKKTRFVAGILAESLSDWSDQPSAFSVPAIGFIDHRETLLKKRLDLRLRVGMFWRRLGYIEPYDTYLIGRTHGAGAAAEFAVHTGPITTIIEGGAMGHKRLANNESGFTPIAWLRLGMSHRRIELNGYYLSTWNDDPKKTQVDEEALGEQSLSVMGFDIKANIPFLGPLSYTFSFIEANQVKFLGYGVEVLHSTRGFFLQETYLGQGDSFGTGEIQTQGLDLTWEIHRSLSNNGRRSSRVKGLNLRLFGLLALVATPEATGNDGSGTSSEDPVGRNDRRYFKWGSELFYRPIGLGWERPYLAVRYDRVIPHTEFDSISFNVWSPRVGVTLEPGMDVFIQWSRYSYGDNVNGGSGLKVPNSFSEERTWSGKEPTAVVPDENVFKIQEQITW